jgi:prefoldin subunit 5
MDNPTALAALQSEKDLLEREAAALRESLHKLRQARREHTQHEKLVIVASKIGALDKRILALVEGKEKSGSESASGV